MSKWWEPGLAELLRISSIGFHSSFGFRHSSFLIARALLGCLLLPAVSTAASQTPSTVVPDANSNPSPLATKQQIVRDRMIQLEDRMFRLIEQLSEREPEQAARLETALRKARELLIRRDMEVAIRLLSDEDLAGASDKQIEIVRDLESVLKVLLEEPDSSRQRQQEIARLEALKAEVRRLLEAQQRLEAIAEAAEPQRQLGEKTDQLGERMSGRKTETQPARPPDPGNEHVASGARHMMQASQELRQQKTEQGAESQRQAEDELRQAIENLEQAIEQLRQEQRDQTLRQLQVLLQAMLDKQLLINRDTQVLNEKGPTQWTHADELALTGLSNDEMTLADQTSQVLRLLKSDGTTVVFPQVMGQVRDDMERVAARLQKKDAGSATQQMEAAIAETLIQLIDSLKQAAANPPPGGAGGEDGQGCNPPLVAASAELKLLRSCQQRLNERTATAGEAIEKNPATASDLRDEIRRLSTQQNELAELARQMHEKWTEKK